MRSRVRTSALSLVILLVAGCCFGAGMVAQYFRMQRMLISGSAPLVFSKAENGAGCPKQATTIGVFGQSNSINRPNAVFPADAELFEYRLSDGKCLNATSSASGIRGNAAYGAILALKQRGMLPGPVVIASWGVNATSVIEWGSGDLAFKTSAAIRGLTRDVGAPAMVLFHQGERDAVMLNRHTGMTGALYQANLQAIASSVHNLSPDTNLGIALVSVCGVSGGSQAVRQAQATVARNAEWSFVSADSDRLTDRVDGCHFTDAATRRLALMYAESYHSYCTMHASRCVPHTSRKNATG